MGRYASKSFKGYGAVAYCIIGLSIIISRYRFFYRCISMLDFYEGISSFDVAYYILMVDSIDVCFLSIRVTVSDFRELVTMKETTQME